MIEENASEIGQVTIPNSPVYPHEFLQFLGGVVRQFSARDEWYTFFIS